MAQRTRKVNASEARQHWSELINSVFRGESRVIVEKSGIPVAAIVSAEDLERLARLDSERARRFQALEASWRAFEDVNPDEVEAEVEKAVEAARQEIRRGPKRKNASA
jgi:prevent-host-death family protein